MPAVIGLVGAAIGSAASITTIIVQSHIKDKRDRAKQIIDLSLAEFGHHLELARAAGRGALLPIGAYIYNNDQILRSIEEGSFGPEKYTDIVKRNRAMTDAIDQADKAGGRRGVKP